MASGYEHKGCGPTNLLMRGVGWVGRNQSELRGLLYSTRNYVHRLVTTSPRLSIPLSLPGRQVPVTISLTSPTTIISVQRVSGRLSDRENMHISTCICRARATFPGCRRPLIMMKLACMSRSATWQLRAGGHAHSAHAAIIDNWKLSSGGACSGLNMENLSFVVAPVACTTDLCYMYASCSNSIHKVSRHLTDHVHE